MTGEGKLGKNEKSLLGSFCHGRMCKAEDAENTKKLNTAGQQQWNNLTSTSEGGLFYVINCSFSLYASAIQYTEIQEIC